jgi:hypothetical protein
MTARQRPDNAGDGAQAGPDTDDRTEQSVEASGPQSPAPWGSTGGSVDRDPPWGESRENPLDEGSEPTGLPDAQRGDRRAAVSGPSRGRGLGPTEPTPFREAGPGAPPDPGHAHRPFPNEATTGDLPDNPLEAQTGMRPEGPSRAG